MLHTPCRATTPLAPRRWLPELLTAALATFAHLAVALSGQPGSRQMVTAPANHPSATAALPVAAARLGAPPANDDCATATPLTSIGLGTCANAQAGTTEDATATPGVPDPGCATYAGGDVWYSLTVPANGIVQVGLDQGSGSNSLSDTGLAVYAGSCGNLSLISCDDDGGPGNFSLVRLTGRTPGETLYARVWKFGGGTGGTFSICALSSPPANDDCTTATPLISIGEGACDTPVAGTTVSATATPGVPDPGCASYAGGDVWYSVTVPPNGIVQVSTDQGSGSNSLSDMGLAVYAGSCGNLSLISCDDDGGPGNFSLVRLTGRTPGETLYVRAWKFGGGAGGTFTICAQTDLTDLIVGAPQAVQGRYRNVTITNNGAALLTGALQVRGVLTVQAGGTLATGCQPVVGPGNFVLQAGARLRICDAAGITTSGATGAIQVAGSRSFSPDAEYVYNGTAAQVPGNGLPATVANLGIDNAAGVTLTSSLTVTNALTLTTGVLTTGGNTVTLGTATGHVVETPTSYVSGRLQQTKDLATAGATTNFGDLGLQVTPAGAALPGTTTVLRVTGTALPGAGSSQSIKRYYTITPTVNTGLSMTVTLGYADANLNGISESDLGVFRSTGSLSGPWQPMPHASQDASANTLTVANVDHFSVWTMGARSAPLPVTLVRFTAEASGPDALLRWTTAQELRNDRFEVEVSQDGHRFRRLGAVAGQGTSTQASTYQFRDAEVARYGATQLYYRLRQVDTDGTAQYSPVAVVRVGATVPLLAVPNPAPAAAAITVTGPTGGLSLYDLLGRRLTSWPAPAEGAASLVLPAGLPAGVYVLRAGQQSLRLVVE